MRQSGNPLLVTRQPEAQACMRLGKLRAQFSSLGSFVWHVGLSALDALGHARAAEARRRPQIAGLHSAKIDDQFFEDNSGIYHRELQGVITRSCQWCVDLLRRMLSLTDVAQSSNEFSRRASMISAG